MRRAEEGVGDTVSLQISPKVSLPEDGEGEVCQQLQFRGAP